MLLPKGCFSFCAALHFSWCEKTPHRAPVFFRERAHVKGRFVLAMCASAFLSSRCCCKASAWHLRGSGEQNAMNAVVMTLYDSQRRKGCFYFCSYTHAERILFHGHSLVKLCPGAYMRLSYSMIRLNWVKRSIFDLKCTLTGLKCFHGVFLNHIGIKNVI